MTWMIWTRPTLPGGAPSSAAVKKSTTLPWWVKAKAEHRLAEVLAKKVKRGRPRKNGQSDRFIHECLGETEHQRLGELLTKTVKHQGGRPPKQGHSVPVIPECLGELVKAKAEDLLGEVLAKTMKRGGDRKSNPQTGGLITVKPLLPS
jgi:hypothetical protein